MSVCERVPRTVTFVPRKPKFFLPGVAVHVLQRGNNRIATFMEDHDYRQYLQMLADAAEREAVEIHSYVLMTNHIHLLVTPNERESASLIMQRYPNQERTCKRAHPSETTASERRSGQRSA